MNPTYWQHTHLRQWESLDPNDNKLSHTMMGTNEDTEHHDPPSHWHSYRLNSSHLYPEMRIEDEELARKRRELQLIEKQIHLKKTTIALKTTPHQIFKEDWEEVLSSSEVDSSVKDNQLFMTYNNRPLKERANAVLQQRWPDGFLVKVCTVMIDLLS